MKTLNEQIATRLRALRQARGWSLGRLEQECGVSKAMLGQIERQESSPTVLTLWRIAKGLHISLSELLPDACASIHQPVEDSGADPLQVSVLLPWHPSVGYEVLLVTLRAGCEYLSCAHENGVTEDVLPLDGELSVLTAGSWQRVAPGAALRFAADVEHGYRNSAPHPVKFHNIVHYRQRLNSRG